MVPLCGAVSIKRLGNNLYETIIEHDICDERQFIYRELIPWT